MTAEITGASSLVRRDGESGKRIAEEVRTAILAGDLPPGTPILQEHLAYRFGASRVPVREALKILESSGLVTLVANSGAWVAQLTRAEFDELYGMRERLEPYLLRLNLALLTAETADELELIAGAMERSTDVEQFVRLDRDFHRLTYSAAHTSTVGELVESLWDRTQHYRRAFTRLFRSEGDASAHHDHQLLIHAIRRQDADEAEHVLYGHIRRTRLELDRHPEIFDLSQRGRTQPS